MTLAPILWLLAFFPALIALYFLKLKRRDVVIASTLLWRRSLEDFRVNAPFQRLRRNLLLLLQLLILAFLIFAIWRPRLSGERTGGRDLILLVDNSASTSATEAGGTRLDLEKREALDLVGGMREGDRMTLIAFSSRTVPLEQATGDRSILEARIRGIQPTALPTDLDGALRVACSIAEALPSAEVRVIGDGAYGDLSALPLEVKRMSMKVISKGTPLENIGITETDVRLSFEAESKREVFALVENFGRTPSAAAVTLAVDGEIRDARKIDLPPGGSVPVVFDVTGVREGMCRVFLDARDALAVDDEAWVRIEPPRTVSVLQAGKPNPWIDLVLEATAGVRHRFVDGSALAEMLSAPTPEEAVHRLDADVLILDREAPAVEPPIPSIYIGCLPALPGSPGPEKVKLPVVVDWDRNHPVNRFLVFTDLHIEESLLFKSEKGYQSLVDAEAGSVVGVLGFQPLGRARIPVILVGFDILKTNWPIGHYSFPIFFSNAISWMAGSEDGRSARRRTGEPLVLVLGPGEDRTTLARPLFRAPSGREIEAGIEEGGKIALAAAEETGVYELRLGGSIRAVFPVSLLDRRESNLVPSASIDLGDFSVAVERSSGEEGRDLWKPLALAAVVVLLLEWRLYTRRQGRAPVSLSSAGLLGRDRIH